MLNKYLILDARFPLENFCKGGLSYQKHLQFSYSVTQHIQSSDCQLSSVLTSTLPDMLFFKWIPHTPFTSYSAH